MKQYNIDGVDVFFDTNWRNVAIAVSGGADSALLAYLLCTLASMHTQKIHIVSHVRMWKTRPWQEYHSQAVYDWLCNKFSNIEFCRHTNFIAPDIEYGNIGPSITDEYDKKVSGDNIQQRSFAEYICSKENIEAYYNAVTHNPRAVDLNGMTERNVEESESTRHLSLVRHMGTWALHPFRFVEKNWIIKQYKRLEIQSLLDITRSCEGEFENINYTNYTPGQFVAVCGECFWCKERAWAIEQNQ